MPPTSSSREHADLANVDLIYSLPRQAEASFRADFEAVAARGVDAVTAYNVRVNERTPVASWLRQDERLDLARIVYWRVFVERTSNALGYRQTRWLRSRGQCWRAPTVMPNSLAHGPNAETMRTKWLERAS